jgi:hypothetical protein
MLLSNILLASLALLIPSTLSSPLPADAIEETTCLRPIRDGRLDKVSFNPSYTRA